MKKESFNVIQTFKFADEDERKKIVQSAVGRYLKNRLSDSQM